MSEHIRNAWLTWMRAECARKPVLLVLEDLHWGDATSVQYVDLALDALAEAPFAVVASTRPEVTELFPNLWKSRALTEIALTKLSRKAAEKLVRAVLKENVTDEDAARLVERSGGNAFFLEELVRCTSEGKGELPTSVIGILTMRLAELDPETRRLLRAASIIGETFWAGAVTHLTRERAAVVSTRIDDLCARELVSRRATSMFPNEHELAFRHALVREAVYATLTDDDKKLGHRLAGEWLEREGARDASILAQHFERGADRENAARHYARAALEAVERNDITGAIALVERGLACHPSAEVTTSLHLTLGRAHRWKGELDHATKHLQIAFDALHPGSAPWFDAGADLVSVIARSGRVSDAADVAGTLLAMKPAPSAGVARAIALARASHLVSYPILMPNARDVIDGARRQIQEAAIDDPLALAQLHSGESAHAMACGSYAEALRASRAAARLFQSIGDARTLLVERFSEMTALCEIGLFDEVITLAPSIIADAQKLRLHFTVALLHRALGHAHMGVGDLATAKRHLTESVEWLGPRTPIEWWPRSYLALVALDEGDIATAAAHVERAVERGKQMTQIRAPTFACGARVKLAQGNPSEALALVREALDMVEKAPGAPIGDLLVRHAYIDVHEGAGETEAAERCRTKSRAVLMERADKIDIPEWRRAYLSTREARGILRTSG